MLEGLDWGSVLSVVFALATTVAAGFWLKAKGKLKQLRDVAKEGYEAIQAVVAAVDDDKIDSAEQAIIKKEALEAWAAIKTLLGIKKE